MAIFVMILLLSPCTYAVTVNTKYGTIEGFLDQQNHYITFYGVPYAGKVTGEHRFKMAPQLISLPQGFKANNSGIVCAHPTPEGMAGQEDCLTLDIFTKNTNTKENMPVFVWLNGGYSKPVDKQFSFKSLVEAGAVVVSMNHRLSIFGFLCLGNENAPGNAGLKDVIQGLHWVKENIENLGGDPNNVILIGHGEGAAIVDLVTLSPQSENLVHKAVALSGSGIAPWAVGFDPEGNAKAFSTELNMINNDHGNLIDHLLKIDLNLLAGVINKFVYTNDAELFAPCIEGNNLGSFLNEAPIDVLHSGNYKKIPYIASFVPNEGTMRIEEALKNNWLEKIEKNMVDFLPVDVDNDNKAELAMEIREFYFGTAPIDKNAIRRFLEYEGHTLVTVAVIRGLRERVEANDMQVYLLNFAFIKQNPDAQWPYNTLMRPGHGEILDYIFDGEPVPEKPKKILINRLLAFAYSGIPTAEANKLGDTSWAPLKKGNMDYLVISGEGSSINEVSNINPIHSAMKLWDKFSYKKPQYASFSMSASGYNIPNSMLIAFIITMTMFYLQ